MEDMRLKPCPFCGEKKFIEISTKERKDRPQCKFTSNVTCLICHGRAGNHGFDWTEEEAIENAIKAWNRRAYPEFGANTRAERNYR